MTTTLTPELIAMLKALSPDDKERAVDLLIEDDDSDSEVRGELQRRWDEYKADGGGAMPVEDYLAELDRRIDAGKRG